MRRMLTANYRTDQESPIGLPVSCLVVRLILKVSLLEQQKIRMYPRITIIIDVASHDEVEQIIKQLNRQFDVIRILIFRISPTWTRRYLGKQCQRQLEASRRF